MKIYFFGGEFEILQQIYDSHFDGTLFLYNAVPGDYFVKVAKLVDPKPGFKYMFAVRPYAISPHYLTMIDSSFRQYMNDSLQINLISGNPRPEEMEYDGFVGNINEHSSKIDKSKYLIEYLDVINSMKVKVPDFYVSITNEYVLEAANKYNNKTIIQYTDLIAGQFKVNKPRSMISIGPLIRETKEEIYELEEKLRHTFHPKDIIVTTEQNLADILFDLESQGIKEFIFFRSDPSDGETERLLSFVKNFKEGKYKRSIK